VAAAVRVTSTCESPDVTRLAIAEQPDCWYQVFVSIWSGLALQRHVSDLCPVETPRAKQSSDRYSLRVEFHETHLICTHAERDDNYQSHCSPDPASPIVITKRPYSTDHNEEPCDSHSTQDLEPPEAALNLGCHQPSCTTPPDLDTAIEKGTPPAPKFRIVAPRLGVRGYSGGDARWRLNVEFHSSSALGGYETPDLRTQFVLVKGWILPGRQIDR
jgi:hypothetical protein